MSDKYIINPHFPKKVMIEISNLCNHNCVFCSNSFSTRRRGLIDDAKVKQIIKEIAQLGVEELSFHGMGEPFSNPRLAEYIELAKNYDISYVYIDTNLGLATPNRLNKVLSAGLDSIKVSLSAADKETFLEVQGKDDYDNVISNLEYLISVKDRYPNLKIYMDFVKLTINRGQEELLRERYGKDITEFWESDLLNQAGNMVGLIDEFSRKTPDVEMCDEPFNRLNITKDCLVSACCMDNDNSLILGDLMIDSMMDIWQSEMASGIRRAMLSGHGLPKKCVLCDLKKIYECEL